MNVDLVKHAMHLFEPCFSLFPSERTAEIDRQREFCLLKRGVKKNWVN